jgi:hypothetical protein
MATRALSCSGLLPMMLLGPSALDRHPTEITEGSSWTSTDMAAQGLHRERRSRRPVRL